MRLKTRLRRKQRGYLIVFPILLIFTFGMLFAPTLQGLIPHTLVENGFKATYKSQYDNTGTKDIGEDVFTHSAPAGSWQAAKYRVTLGQVTTWDEYTLADQNDDYGSHTFEGSGLTNEETYNVEFDFGDGTTPTITRTADPTDTANLNPGIGVNDKILWGDWNTAGQLWVVDTNSVGGGAEDGYWQDCENDIADNDGWTFTETDDDFTHSVVGSGTSYEGSWRQSISTVPVAGDTGNVQLYKIFTPTSDNNVWLCVAVEPIASEYSNEIFLEIQFRDDPTYKYYRLWIDDDTACPGNAGDVHYEDLVTTDGAYTYWTGNLTQIALDEFSMASFDAIQVKMMIVDNSGAGGSELRIDALGIHGLDDGTSFPDHEESIVGIHYYNRNGLVGETGAYAQETDDQLIGDNALSSTNNYYWDWEINNALEGAGSGGLNREDVWLQFDDGAGANQKFIYIVPTANTDVSDANNHYEESDATSGELDIDAIFTARSWSLDTIDSLYSCGFDARAGSDALIIEKSNFYDGYVEVGEETFVADAGVNDPAGTDFYQMQIDVTGGAVGYTLQTSDLTLSDDWSDWSVESVTGNGNAGAWVIELDDYSGAWEDLDGTFTIQFVADVNDADGYTIDYSLCKVGCSIQDMGLSIDEATATIDNFDGDGATITYDNEGGTLVFSVELDTTDGMNGAKTIVWTEDNYSGALTDWLFTYDLNYRVRDYVSCNTAGITINTETPTYIALTGGAVIVLQNDLDASIEFDETGDEIPDNDIDNCIFAVAVEGDYTISHRPDITADDDEIGYFTARYTRTVTPLSTPTLQSNPVKFRFGSDYGDFGDIRVSMKQPGGDMEHLIYLTEFTIEDGSTVIDIKRGVFSGADWQSGEYEFWIRFNADEDAYYELTNTEAEDLIGLTITGWEKYTDIMVTETQNEYIMKGLIENVDVREEFCFSVGNEIPSKYEGYINNAEIWRYETGQSGEEIFTNIYGLTPNEAKTKWWGNYHISPKYDDFLMLYIDTPTMTIEKIRAENTEHGSYKQLNVKVSCYEDTLEDIYMDIDLGEQNILPQRYNFLIMQWTGEGITEVVEGRVRDYHLLWKRDTMDTADYNYIVFLKEKTASEKFEYLWLQLTQQEIITGGVTLVTEEAEVWEYPTIDIPTPEISIPEMPGIKFPSIRARITPINWGAIGERLIYYGRFASGYSSLIGALTVTLGLVIIVNQFKSMQSMNTQQKKAISR